ncbi:lytic transglycosylase [Paramesorhizobium deserti]|uniref:Lytic transglycosylase n=1 Tax=Paramesorhizobium deserti TaxID=1494590 RepID=A0A135HUD2_9HYPH|nr:transglycosylase SLT domain-containing protein [Paramesorhizobium deserti]KXF76805.1 lytic transglycosylase [Paramesorhizobium deserti]
MSKKFGVVCALVGAMGLLGSNVAYSAPAVEKTSIAAIIKAKKEAAAEKAAEAAKAETKAVAKKRHTVRKATPAKKKAVKAATTKKKVVKATTKKKTVKTVSRKKVSKKAVTAKVTTSRAGGSPYASIINRYAATYGVPTSLAHAVVRHESGYRADARGAAGEIGLMQLKLSTARGLGYTGSAKGLYDPATNVQYGMKYLAMARKLGGGSTCGTILKYNAGHGATRMNPISAAYCSRVKVYMRSF